MVFQDEQLFPHRDVASNIGFGLKMAGHGRAGARPRASPSCSTSSASPGSSTAGSTDLSGGEAKRVALARSLAPQPLVLLLDEPLTGLDRELHDRLVGEVATVLRSTGITAVWVTHDRAEADAVADRIVTADLTAANPVPTCLCHRYRRRSPMSVTQTRECGGGRTWRYVAGSWASIG